MDAFPVAFRRNYKGNWSVEAKDGIERKVPHAFQGKRLHHGLGLNAGDFRHRVGDSGGGEVIGINVVIVQVGRDLHGLDVD